MFRLRFLPTIAVLSLALSIGARAADATMSAEPPSVSRGSLRGILMPIESRQLSARQPGVIEKFGAEEGQHVEQGALLVQLNSDIERADVARSEAVVESTESEWVRTKKELDRAIALKADGIGSDKEFEEIEYAHALATARRKQAAADLEMARARLRERTITAPISGLLFRRNRSVGEAVERLETVVRLVDASKLELVVYAGAELLGKFRNNQPAQIMVETGAARGTLVPAVISYVDPTMDPESGTFRIKLQVEPTEKIQTGISVILQVPSEVN